MSDHHAREVENYTMPFLVMAFLLLFMGLFTLWALFGYLFSLTTGLFVHAAIKLIPNRN